MAKILNFKNNLSNLKISAGDIFWQIAPVNEGKEQEHFQLFKKIKEKDYFPQIAQIYAEKDIFSRIMRIYAEKPLYPDLDGRGRKRYFAFDFCCF